MNHNDFWHAIDTFAQHRGLTCSGMARQCGLDATIFNPSKRFSKYGQPRWLSVETVARMLNTYGITFREFAQYFPDRPRQPSK